MHMISLDMGGDPLGTTLEEVEDGALAWAREVVGPDCGLTVCVEEMHGPAAGAPVVSFTADWLSLREIARVYCGGDEEQAAFTMSEAELAD